MPSNLSKGDFIRCLYGYFKNDKSRKSWLIFKNLFCDLFFGGKLEGFDKYLQFIPLGTQRLRLVNFVTKINSNFKGMNKLVYLKLVGVSFENKKTKFPNTIRSLHLGKIDVFTEIMELFPQNLKKLSFDAKGLKSFKICKYFPKLESLSISNIHYIDNSIINHFPVTLRELFLKNMLQNRGIFYFSLVHLKQLNSLEIKGFFVKNKVFKDGSFKKLTLNSCIVHGNWMKFLEDKIESLNIFSVLCIRNENYYLKIPKKIKELHFSYFNEYENEIIIDVLERISELIETEKRKQENLEKLSLSEFSFGDGKNILEKIKKNLPNDKIKTLYIDYEFNSLKEFKNLVTLNLNEMSNSFSIENKEKWKDIKGLITLKTLIITIPFEKSGEFIFEISSIIPPNIETLSACVDDSGFNIINSKVIYLDPFFIGVSESAQHLIMLEIIGDFKLKKKLHELIFIDTLRTIKINSKNCKKIINKKEFMKQKPKIELFL